MADGIEAEDIGGIEVVVRVQAVVILDACFSRLELIDEILGSPNCHAVLSQSYHQVCQEEHEIKPGVRSAE